MVDTQVQNDLRCFIYFKLRLSYPSFIAHILDEPGQKHMRPLLDTPLYTDAPFTEWLLNLLKMGYWYLYLAGISICSCITLNICGCLHLFVTIGRSSNWPPSLLHPRIIINSLSLQQQNHTCPQSRSRATSNSNRFTPNLSYQQGP